MKLLHVVFIQFMFLFVLCDCALDVAHVGNNTDSYLNSPEIIRKHGYLAESHFVVTEDGYILEVHRIRPKKSHHDQTNYIHTKKPPILLQHGLLGTSTDYLLIGNNSLGFILADMGFDVWLGNVRGSFYSLAHMNLFTDQKQFWNYSWHESAVYDLPAEIDFILNHTKQEKIVYVGLSMGTTMFLTLTSTRPEYNEKFEVALLMAAVAYMKHVKSPLLKVLVPFSNELQILAELIGNGEFLPSCKLLSFLGEIFCEQTNTQANLCRDAIFLLVGSDPKEFDKSILPILINHYPAGYSVKGVNHYAQLIKSGKFRQYDYGWAGNMRQYGTHSPPDYNLKLITTPIYIYEGNNDLLSTKPDVKVLAKQLRNLKAIRMVSDPKFTHLDFIISKHVKKLVYDGLVDDLMSSLKDK